MRLASALFGLRIVRIDPKRRLRRSLCLRVTAKLVQYRSLARQRLRCVSVLLQSAAIRFERRFKLSAFLLDAAAQVVHTRARLAQSFRFSRPGQGFFEASQKEAHTRKRVLRAGVRRPQPHRRYETLFCFLEFPQLMAAQTE
jgi:hypothetical protein